ncbi:MAG: response regulator [Gemmatimonadaceae bacterium]|nr:response regulator [Gemmatimonadaceae bacterium]
MTETPSVESRPPIKRSLHRRLIAVGFASAVTTGLLLGAIAVFNAREQQSLRQTTTRVLEEQRIGDAVIRGVMRQLSIAGEQTQRGTARQISQFDSTGQEVYEHLRGYLSRPLSPAERQQIELVKEQHQGLEVAARRLMNSPSSSSSYSAAASDDMVQHAFELLDVLRTFVSMREAALESLADTQATTLRRVTLAGMLFVGVFALVQALVLARFVRRRVTSPLGELSDAVARVGAGDLDVRLPAAPDHEFHGLVETFNDMSARLTTARADLEARNASLSDALAQVRTTQDELVRNETLSAIGRMTAGLAHELNNPLATVLASSELLASRLRDGTPPSTAELDRDYAAPILHEARRARLLVRSMLQFARRGDAEVRPVPFRESLDVVMELRQFAFTAASVRLEAGNVVDACIMAEPQHLQGVLLNVLNNALDALAGHARADGAPRVVRIDSHRDEHSLVVTITDNGPGLSDPARVFEAFYTTKGVGEGTGLGLALVDRFMTSFGGSVSAGNVPEGGARFTLVFRLAESHLLPSHGCSAVARTSGPLPALVDDTGSEPQTTPRERAHARPRILVVDDEEPLLRAQELLLRRLQVDVVVCSSVSAALEVLSVQTVDVVLCDVKMPGASGVALFEWVERSMPPLVERFAFVTGDVDAPELARFSRERPSALIAKPFDVREYLEQVRRLLAVATPLRVE